MKISLSRTLSLATLSILAVVSMSASAAFPEKPVRIIVPYSPGGTSDVLTRLVARYMEPALGKPVAIVNIDGGGGAVGWSQAKDATADGYTITSYSDAMDLLEATKASTFTQKDFEPVAMVGNVYLTVTAKGGDGPYKSFKDYVDAARKKPNEVGLAMGRGTLSQFVAALVAESAGADLKLVNAGGGAQKKTAVLGGHVDAMVEPMPGVVAQHQAGQLRILAVLSERRMEATPDVPTAREQGVDVVAPFMQGFLAPKGTPKDRIAVLEAAVRTAVNNPEFKAAAAKANLIVEFRDAQGFGQQLVTARDRTLRIGKKLGF